MSEKITHKPPQVTPLALLLVCAALLPVGCERKPKQAVECPEQDTGVQLNVTNLGTAGVNAFKNENEPAPDRCVACVMSQQRFASCQTVYAESKDEARDSVRARAKEKACLDAGYKKGQCPENAVISLRCKDEPRPEGAMDPGQAIQKLFGKNKKIQVLTKPQKTEGDPKPEAPKPEAPKKDPKPTQ